MDEGIEGEDDEKKLAPADWNKQKLLRFGQREINNVPEIK